MTEPLDEHEIRSFLLGELSSEDRERIEQEFLTNPDYREHVHAVESELIEDYLNGRLSPEETTQFKKHLASAADQQRRIRLSGLIRKRMFAGPSSAPVHDHGANGSSAVAMSVLQRLRNPLVLVPAALIVIVAALLAIYAIRTMQQIRDDRIATENRRAALQHELTRLNDASRRLEREKERIFSTTLLSIATRGPNTTVQIRQPRHTAVIDVKLVVTGDSYPSYRAVIQSLALTEGFTISDLVAETNRGNNIVSLLLPYSLLSEGEYRIRLRGQTSDGKLEDVGEYVFQIKSQ